MGLHRTADIESRFVAYVDGLASVIGHGDRKAALDAVRLESLRRRLVNNRLVFDY
jgi:hypothetical protein